tara:strand:- start:109 stop:558 length:450 start_codon:yes stop_codon:yes gene_type:complete
MLWLYLAIGTAISWGAGYALSERFLHNGISAPFFLACLGIFSAPIFLFMSFKSGKVQSSIQILLHGEDRFVFYSFLGSIIMYAIGSLLINYAIQLKNATYVNLIEITYPLFTIIFTYILYRNLYLNWATALGAMLVISGVLLIIYKGHA